ncbi:hypothetical protein AC622_07255 [Bacillus sp. FJAT-27916]|nr:hypothetical protein AC622_07255 [Bacillus sp. FJAT-27916]
MKCLRKSFNHFTGQYIAQFFYVLAALFSDKKNKKTLIKHLRFSEEPVTIKKNYFCLLRLKVEQYFVFTIDKQG